MKKNPHAVALGRLGGKAGTGAVKARRVTKAAARRAAMARWQAKPHARKTLPHGQTEEQE